MSKNTGDMLPNIFPVIRYRNAPAAIAWLTEAFGFEKQMVVPGLGGTIAHAQLKLGPGVIMLGSVGNDEPGKELVSDTQGVYIYVEDVDAHFERAKAAGADVGKGLTDTDYGSREYTARDLEGYLWSFGTYRPER